MRILHILDHSLPHQSGYVFRTLSILREQRAIGWETLQLTTPRHGASDALDESIDGWHFFRTPLHAGSRKSLPGYHYLQELRATQRRLEQLIRVHRPDILHAHSPVLNALPALWAARRHGLPVVYEVRALWEDAAADHGTAPEGSLRYRLSRMIETYVLRRVDHVTTICQGLRDEIAQRGIAAARITVIPNAVDTDAFQLSGEADAALKHSLGLDKTVVIGFAGSFYRYEGLDLLIEALARLQNTMPDARLLLVGGGPHEANLRSLAQRLGIAAKVVFTGRVPQRDVKRYYDLIDVLAYPRHRMRLTELVTPLKPLEAMAQGRLLVASDVGGHKELIRHGSTGLLFPAGDADALAQMLQRALSSPKDAERMRAEGRHFVTSERTWARSVAEYMNVYSNLTRSLEQSAPALRQL
jgi:phosphatidyl-myo-inositol dimannoside synthase